MDTENITESHAALLARRAEGRRLTDSEYDYAVRRVAILDGRGLGRNGVPGEAEWATELSDRIAELNAPVNCD